MKNIIYVLFLIGLTSLTIPVQAEITVEIDVQDSFGLGDTIFYNYTLISDNDTQAIIIPYIECPSAPVAPMMEKTIILEKNLPYEDVYYNMVVEDFFETQTCTAYIQLISPIQQREEKTFAINTNPSFSFDVSICKDQLCTEKSKTFVKNTDIYLNYDSDISGLSITATLIHPDKTTQQLTLPSSIKADQIGTYTLDVTASKQDYKTITKRAQFAVIESETDIPETTTTTTISETTTTILETDCGNDICDIPEGENYETCSQDCLSGGEDGYCDAVSDGICDPDCSSEEDEDCGLPMDITGIILLAGIAIGLMLVYWYLKGIARKSEEVARRIRTSK